MDPDFFGIAICVGFRVHPKRWIFLSEKKGNPKRWIFLSDKREIQNAGYF